MVEFVIAHIGDLTSWIEANLPDLDEDHFHPWTAGPAAPGALTARIQVRVHSLNRCVRQVSVEVSAEPLHSPTGRHPTPRMGAPPHPSTQIRGEH
ncbi:hypothetical protein OIE68_00445 [Nocardia vinacea]|uniref:hypothetical protein n=1 Tax=Nocardia vinacea TaxID=96468 RepID=UPI002E0ECFC6|nr:hypothetical protein OIE68_00445 [Nocardia vinacea]